MKTIILIFLLSISQAHAEEASCRIEDSALMDYENRILQASQDFERSKDLKDFTKRITPPLICLLEIQEKGTGFLKYLAHSFLRPLLGGSQTPGLMADRRYKAVAEAATRLTEMSPDVLHGSIVALHAQGSWDFYRSFCEGENSGSCSAFLPDESMIRVQSPLIGASSMLLLHRAYRSVKGKERENIANRIRNLYRETPETERLKSKTIQEIYREIFNPVLSAVT